MIEYCFVTYKATTLARAGEVLVEAMPIHGATVHSVDLVAGADAVLLLRQGETYERTLSLPETLDAPIRAGQAVGKAYFTGPDGNVVAEIDLLPQMDVPCATLWDHVRRVFVNWLHG